MTLYAGLQPIQKKVEHNTHANSTMDYCRVSIEKCKTGKRRQREQKVCAKQGANLNRARTHANLLLVLPCSISLTSSPALGKLLLYSYLYPKHQEYTVQIYRYRRTIIYAPARSSPSSYSPQKEKTSHQNWAIPFFPTDSTLSSGIQYCEDLLCIGQGTNTSLAH